jgi:hypothetical protein
MAGDLRCWSELTREGNADRHDSHNDHDLKFDIWNLVAYVKKS